MLTLNDINTLTNSHDGDIYSDLYKDVYGCRPRYVTFINVEEFDADYERLVVRLNEQMEEERKQRTKNREQFEWRVKDTMELVSGIDRVRAIEIIADAEDELQSMKWYGYESLEYHFDLGYGYIKGTLG